MNIQDDERTTACNVKCKTLTSIQLDYFDLFRRAIYIDNGMKGSISEWYIVYTRSLVHTIYNEMHFSFVFIEHRVEHSDP